MSFDKNYNSTFKVLVLGESGVGKTSIIRRFTEEQYQESYISTIGIDSRSKVVNIGDENVRLQIWDTAGQERFRTLTSAYYRGAMGIILVYDVTSEYSFSSITNWLETIVQNESKNVCKLLVGNKIDCEEDYKVISTEKGKERADDTGLQFFETSAKTGDKINEVFMEMGKMINEAKRKKLEEAQEPNVDLLTTKQHSGSSCSC